MKKNLVLSAFLVLLLILTYFVQERSSERRFQEVVSKDQLIAAEDIKSLKLQNLVAEKKDGQWWSGDNLLSHNVFRQIETKISQIKKVKTVGETKESYFSDPLIFFVNDEKWLIGDMTLGRQGFYLARGDEVIIARIVGSSHELTDDEHAIDQVKLDELKRLFNTPPAELQEKQLFRYYPDLPKGIVLVQMDGTQDFELDLEKNATLPPPPVKGIEVHEKLVAKFTSLLSQITLRKEVPYNENLKFSKLGQITFSKADKKVMWQLWLSSDKSADTYLIDDERKKSWLMVGGTLKVFFTHLQDYWDKKVIPPSLFKNFSRLDTTLIQGNKSASVEILNREPLGFVARGKKVQHENMNLLFRYIFNLAEKDQANRVSPLSKTERQQILTEDNLRLEIMGQELVLWRKAHELIVVNLTQGFKAHFYDVDEKFHANFQDVLE
jgi:hypothetical protein